MSRYTDSHPLEARAVLAGLVLAGLAIAVTGVSYLINMKFPHQWLVWGLGLAFIAVGVLTIEWPRALYGRKQETPQGRFRQILLMSIPLAFILSSQVCGLGISACNAVCHITNTGLIVLGVVTAVRLHRGQTVGVILIPMVVIGLLPHCVCHAPINVLWHRMLGGVSPTCEMMPLSATLFAVMALRGVRPRSSSVLIGLLFVVMAFIIVGGMLFKFPWQGCVDHPQVSG
jgi:hypothetical protein